MAKGMVLGLPDGENKAINGSIQKTFEYGEEIGFKKVAIVNTIIDIRRRTITSDPSKVGAVLTNYPGRIELNSSNFDFSVVRNDGNDIRFLNSEDQLIPFEKTYFDKTEEKAIFDFLVNSLSSTAETTITMVYGDDNSNDLSNPAGTWNNNYQAVFHFDSNLLDSTSNDNDITNHGTTEVDGLSGKARYFDGGDYLEVNDNTLTDTTGGTNDTTFQAITNQDVQGSEQILISYRGSLSPQSAEYALSAGKNPSFDTSPPSGGKVVYNQDVPINQYNILQLAVSQNNNEAIFDINNLTSTINYTETYTGGTPSKITIGALSRPDIRTFFRGIMDEFRISSTILSDEWRAADRYNIFEKNLFTLGEETGGGGITTVINEIKTIGELRTQVDKELVITQQARVAGQTGDVLSILR